jgi:hypothetical protein
VSSPVTSAEGAGAVAVIASAEPEDFSSEGAEGTAGGDVMSAMLVLSGVWLGYVVMWAVVTCVTMRWG